MIDEMKKLEIECLFRDLLKTYQYSFKKIGHKVSLETIVYDILQLMMQYICVNGEFSDEKIEFAKKFYLIISKNDNDSFERKIKLVPNPYPNEFLFPVSYKHSVVVDNLRGSYELTLKYFVFVEKVIEFLNSSFDDIEFNKVLNTVSYFDSLRLYAASFLIKFDDFSDNLKIKEQYGK